MGLDWLSRAAEDGPHVDELHVGGDHASGGRPLEDVLRDLQRPSAGGLDAAGGRESSVKEFRSGPAPRPDEGLPVN